MRTSGDGQPQAHEVDLVLRSVSSSVGSTIPHTFTQVLPVPLACPEWLPLSKATK